jgi:3-phenylpropionate/trans-cinnamate dioxygenase ferredoxin reductase component
MATDGGAPMNRTKYLIIGAGMSSDTAVRAIQERDPEGKITVVGRDIDPPYVRPMLSKALWKNKKLEDAWLKTEDLDIELITGREIHSLDTGAKTAVDSFGDNYTYEFALLATGARPKPFPLGGDLVINYRSVSDYSRLRVLTERGERFVVIGNGFIGSEIAAALAMNNKQVTLIFPGKSIGEKMFPKDLAESLNVYYRKKKVDIWDGEEITAIDQTGEAITVTTKSKVTGRSRSIEVDGVVAGIGAEPNIELAEAAGIKTDDGVVVDAMLQTSAPGVYAVGDIASYWQQALGINRRVEHEDNAKTMGTYAGHNMAGAKKAYDYIPMFYSDLFDLGYEAVGELDAKLDLAEDWSDPLKTGVVYYLKDDQIRGVLLWNVWDQVDAARKLIDGKAPYSKLTDRQRIPNK